MAASDSRGDPAHRETDKLLKELEGRISALYKEAEKDVKAKLDDYMRRFEKKDETWKKWVKEGKKTEAEYKQWRTGQIAIGKRWEELLQTLAEDFHNANRIARSVTDGYMPEVYALNHNYSTYTIEKGAKVDTSYTLYDRQTVERLLRDNPDLLPPPGRKTSERIRKGLDVRWNKQQIQSVMLQAILQGEPIPDIATRLANAVGDSNRKAAIRNARTMTTGAENAGRVDGMNRARSMGIKVKKTWLATLDGRTRHEHRLLDGQTVDTDKPFKVEGREILYPGDPTAHPSLVYNCRCTLISKIEGFERDVSDTSLRHDANLGNMSYKEWKESRKTYSNPITLPEKKAAAIRWSYIKKYMGL